MITLSDNFWRRLNVIAGLFVLMATFALLVFVANLEIKDMDLWLHLGMGKYIVQHHFHVPTVDILSCTVAGTPWVNHEWLFQVIVYLIHSHWGFEGLINMQVWLVASTMLILVFLGYNRENQLTSLFALFLVTLVYQNRFTIRPDLFSLFFFATYIAILALYINRWWSLIILFFVQLLWSNMHGFFFLGPFLVLLGITGEWIKRHIPLPWEWNKVSRLSDEEYNRMGILLGIVATACFFTPQGLQGAIYPLKVLFQISGDSHIFFEKIIELQKPITQANIFSPTDWPYYKILIVISFLSFIFNRRKLDVGIFFFWLFFLFFSLVAIRNMVFFAFAAFLVFVTNMLTVKFNDIVPIRFTSKKFLYITSAFIKLLLVFWIIHYYSGIADNGYFDFAKYRRKSEFGGISLRQYPDHAVDFLVKNKVTGNFFNDFNSGAYFVGRCYPAIKVFIDGRTEVYGPAFFNYYRNLTEFDNAEKFKVALKRFQITGAFMNSVQNPIPPSTLNYLYKNKEWVLVYLDYDGAIFLKDVPINREVIRKNRIDLTKLKAREMDLYRLGAKDILPYQNVNRAFSYESLGFYDLAIAEAKAALKVNPHYASPYKLLGKIATEKKDFETAFEYFRLAATVSYNDQSARMNMAQALLDLKRYDQAAEQYQKNIDIWPKFAKAYFKMARVNLYRKLYPQAFNALKKGYELDPRAGDQVLEGGDLFVEAKEFDLSQKTYELVSKKEPKKAIVYLKLYDIFLKNGNREKAAEILKSGLKQIPENKDIKEKLRNIGVRTDSPGMPHDVKPLVKL